MEFAGLKITQDPKMARLRPQWGVHSVRCIRDYDKLVTGTLGQVGWGGNGGFQALNLAVQFGARRIVLVGYDMQLAGGMHWHGPHPAGMNNPTEPNVARWRRVIDAAAETLAALDIEVLNASPVSALQSYRKVSLEEALATDSRPARRGGRPAASRRGRT